MATGTAPPSMGRGIPSHTVPSTSRRSPGAPMFRFRRSAGSADLRPANTNHDSGLRSSEGTRASVVWKLYVQGQPLLVSGRMASPLAAMMLIEHPTRTPPKVVVPSVSKS